MQLALGSVLKEQTKRAIAESRTTKANAGKDEHLDAGEQMSLALEFIEACIGAKPQSQLLKTNVENAWTMLSRLIPLVDDDEVKHLLFVASKG